MLDRSNLPFWVAVVLIVLDFSVKAVALGLVPTRRRPSSAMAWLLLIFLMPGVGLLLFVLLGCTFVNRRRRRVQAQAGMIVLQNNVYPSLPATATGPDWLRETLTLNAKVGWLDPVAGSRIELYTDFDASVAAMAAEVDRAERFVHVESSVVGWDDGTHPLFTALVAAVKRGVPVRLLYDHRASRRIHGAAKLPARLEGTGIQRPRQPSRTRSRRNLLVVDGRVGFGGSQDLIHPAAHDPRHERVWQRSKELVFRAEGPLAHSLGTVFAADWYLECAEQLPHDYFCLPPAYADGAVGQVVASGPGLPHDNNLRMLNSLIYGARRRISITSPYLVPDESLLAAIDTAAQRGVAVELFVSGESDHVVLDHAQKSNYTALLEAGVRIFRHPGPPRLHAKHLSVDDAVAVFGSSSPDHRSGMLAAEVSVLILGREIVARVRQVEDSYRVVSTEVTLAAWRKRPLAKRYLDNVMRLTSALQ